MEKIKVYISSHWISDDLYGMYMSWDRPDAYPTSQEDPRVRPIAESLKATVLAGVPQPTRIESETVVLRAPFKDEGLEFKGTIAWKAELFWEDK